MLTIVFVLLCMLLFHLGDSGVILAEDGFMEMLKNHLLREESNKKLLRLNLFLEMRSSKVERFISLIFVCTVHYFIW